MVPCRCPLPGPPHLLPCPLRHRSPSLRRTLDRRRLPLPRFPGSPHPRHASPRLLRLSHPPPPSSIPPQPPQLYLPPSHSPPRLPPHPQPAPPSSRHQPHPRHPAPLPC